MTSSQRVVAIVQARMGSSRLPGKVLLPLGSRSVLASVIARLRRATLLDDVIIATTTDEEDDVICNTAREIGVNVFRGSQDDVLSRFVGAADQSNAQTIVRVTADCPLIDPDLVDQVIDAYLACRTKEQPCDYVSNTIVRTFPRGLDTEVFSIESLLEAHVSAFSEEDREHVTPFIYRQRGRYRLEAVKSESDYSHQRWTLDTKEDYQFIQAVVLGLGDYWIDCGYKEILQFISWNPQLLELNAKITQRTIRD